MSLAAQTAWALGRAAIVSGTALSLGAPLARLIASSRGRRKLIASALLLAPFLTPSILTGYAWAHTVLDLTMRPGWSELVYATALILRLTPVAALVLYFLPAPLSAEAAHCFRLIRPAPGGAIFTAPISRWNFRLRGAGAGPCIAIALGFLLAFGEFEIAAMWSFKTWTVALFDAQTGGLALPQTLWLSAFPSVCQISVLAILLSLSARATPSPGTPNVVSSRPIVRAVAWIYLLTAAALLALFPLGIVLRQAFTGWRAIGENLVLGRDIAAGVFFATGSAVLAHTAAAFVPRRVAMWSAFAAPGLLGGLVLSLLALALFQTPILRPAYDSPLPLLAVLTLLLLPFALLLRGLCEAARPAPAMHLARMIGDRRLIWHLDTRRSWWALFLLFCWGYFDFTASSILAPIGMTPVFVRLHNLSHYGQTAVLSAMLCAALAVPPLVLLLTAAARGLYARARGD